jgi:UDP-glucose:(heptosyl)LPS alpha-1,3-glucosyltransferase
MEDSIKAYSGFERLRKSLTRFLNPVNHYNPVLEGRIFSSAKKIIAVSEKVKEEIIRFYGSGLEEKIVVIPNGIDVEKFSPEIKTELRLRERKKLGYGKNDFVLGFASSNFKLKGLPLLVEVLSELPDNFKLLVAGGRNPKKYVTLAQKLGVRERIKFLGKVKEMEKFYSVIDCLVHPSFYDTFGNVVAEALSMRVPVVVSSNTGAKDLVVEGKTGYVIDVDKEGIRRAILKVWKLLPDFSEVKLMNDEEVFNEYVSLAESILEEKVEKTGSSFTGR